MYITKGLSYIVDNIQKEVHDKIEKNKMMLTDTNNLRYLKLFYQMNYHKYLCRKQPYNLVLWLNLTKVEGQLYSSTGV